MKKYLYRLCWVLMAIISLPAFGQTPQTISGTISDKNGTIPGVSIYEKDLTSNGARSDDNGKFSFTLKTQSKIVVVSMIGYLKKEINVTGKSKIAVQIEEDVKGLEEVVVIGYGEKTKITNTGATASISGDDIRQSPSASLQNTLAGRLPGFFSEQRSGQPGKDGASFQIRGVSTYAGSTSPLIIVDDIEFTLDQVSQIDPNEIQSITILKDASTTAVYGVRGANGVLIVTTKRGKAGKPQLNFRNETGFNTPTQNLQVNDGYTTLRLLKESLAGQYVDPAVSYPNYFSGNNLDHYRTGDSPYLFPSVNWWKTLLAPFSLQNRSNFDISGGTEKTKYFVSLGYITQGGIYKDFSAGQGYDANYFNNRYNFRSNLDLDPNKTLHIRIDLSGRYSITNSPNDAPWNGGANTFQYLWNGQLSSFSYPVYNQNGSFGGYTLGVDVKPNPIANLTYSGYNRAYDNNLNFVTQVKQKLDFISPGLSANGLVSILNDYTFTTSLTRNTAEIPTYHYDPASGLYQSIPLGGNLYRLGPLTRDGSGTGSTTMVNVQAALNYNRNFGKHNFSGLLMLNQTTTSLNSAVTINSVSTLVAGDPYNVRGIVGRLSYNYNNKYLLDVNAAYNGSSKFLADKKYALYPAVSAGWNISEEPFFKNNVTFVDALKIRGSFGLTGNDGIGSTTYNYDKTYTVGSGKAYTFGQASSTTTSAGLIEPTLENHDITWETQRDADVGMDVTLFHGSLVLNADYFYKLRYDILNNQGVTVPSAAGALYPLVNLGRVQNKGYELNLSYSGHSKKLNYFANANVSYAANKIVYEAEGVAKYPWLGNTGKPVGAQFGYTSLGFYQDIADVYQSAHVPSGTPLKNLFPGGIKLADLNGDGVVDQYDQGYLGTNQPAYTAGLSFGFSYKGFDFSTLFQGSLKYIISIQRDVLAYGRPANQSIPFNLSRWTPANAADASFPGLAGGAQNSLISSYWYRSGDYVRWKNIQIGYSFPSAITRRLNVKTIRLYVNGYNIALLYTGLPVFIDPESVVSSAAGEYPQQRIYNVGLQIGL